jgi:hypothetical protein
MKAIESVPSSLYRPLSEKLVSIILGSENIDAVSEKTVKEIIYFWRLDQLASPKGLEILLRAASLIDFLETVRIIDNLGLQELKEEVKTLHTDQLHG